MELILTDERYPIGTTIWRHGENQEAAMVVTVEMRDAWKSEGKSAVDEMFAWIDRVHAYQGRDTP